MTTESNMASKKPVTLDLANKLDTNHKLETLLDFARIGVIAAGSYFFSDLATDLIASYALDTKLNSFPNINFLESETQGRFYQTTIERIGNNDAGLNSFSRQLVQEIRMWGNIDNYVPWISAGIGAIVTSIYGISNSTKERIKKFLARS